jgi:hypothetical protein
MRARAPGIRQAFAVAAWLGTFACGPVTPTQIPPPQNSCVENPCEAYDSPEAVECVAGACVVSAARPADGGASLTGDLVLTVSTTTDALYAPGRTLVVSFDALRPRDGGAPGVGVLPGLLSPSGYYHVAPSVATNEVQWNLDPVSKQNDTSLPVHATFQPVLLTNPDGTNVAASPLPLQPVTAAILQSDVGGPGGSPTTEYVANDMQAGTYLRTVTPDPPFDEAFGPTIAYVPISNAYDYGLVNGYDTTGTVNATLPGATITRARGSFDGWTAFLRDTTTGAVISNVAPLQGQSTSVTFTVLRIASPLPDGGPQPDQDAFDDAVLVVQPPSGSVEPAYLGNIINDVLAAPRYPTLPAPVLVEGTILGDGQPVAADLVFEAIGITDAVNGPPQLDTQSFELTRWVSVDPNAAGQYSVVLPPGEYRFDVRPRDMAHAVLVRDLQVPVQDDPLRVDVSLGTPTSAGGSVFVADGLPLAGAIVEALPTQCAQPASLRQVASTSWCLPRPAQTTTVDGGSFRLDLDLDPGQYSLVTKPPQGSRLPWVSSPELDVTTGDAGTIVVPAPIALGLQLIDPSGGPIPNALVRAFRTSAQGPAVELGNAVTDATGRYEMYVAPPN